MNGPESTRPAWYRPDIDGLRAIAVVLLDDVTDELCDDVFARLAQ